MLGASIAGLLAARVLSGRYDEVLLLERDELPAGAAPRKGTPQALHPHGLLARGKQALEELFPGFSEALVAQGAAAGDLLAGVVFKTGVHRLARDGRAGIGGLAVSRPAVEAELRRRVLALAKVCAMTGVNVSRPVLGAAGQRVSGVSVSRLDGSSRSAPIWRCRSCRGRGLWCSGWPAPGSRDCTGPRCMTWRLRSRFTKWYTCSSRRRRCSHPASRCG